MPTKQINYKKYYEGFGIQLTEGDELQGQCPFCDKEDHFFVNPQTGQYSCKRCGEEGNSWSFLTNLLNLATSEGLEQLADDRGISLDTLEYCKVSVSPISGEYLLPAYAKATDGKVKLLNIYRAFQRKDGSYQVSSSSAPCQQQPYLYDLSQNKPTLVICEGHWDALALVDCLAHLRESPTGALKLRAEPDYENSLLNKIGVVGMPGSGVFKKEWSYLYKNRQKIILIYDNDESGQKGLNRTLGIIEEGGYEKQMQKLSWPDDTYNDINDIHKENNPLKTWKYINENLTTLSLNKKETEEKDSLPAELTAEPIPCKTFDELCGYYEQELEFTPALRSTLATMIAVILSTRVGGGQLGLRVIGPPGSAKSTLAEALSRAREYVYPTSKFTGLVSGFDKLKKTDKQIGEKMNGKNVLIKDADTFLTLTDRARIESEIRDVLGDGVIRSEYRNNAGHSEISTDMTMTLCGTKALRAMDLAQLGSRFVDIVIHEEGTDTTTLARRAIRSQMNAIAKSLADYDPTKTTKKKSVDVLAPPTYGFIQEKKALVASRPSIQSLSQKTEDTIHALGRFIAKCRTGIEKQGADVKYRPESEVETRLVENFTRLAVFLAITLNKRGPVIVTKEILGILRKITLDTAYGFRLDILRELYYNEDGLDKERLSLSIDLRMTQTYNLLQDMRSIRLISLRQVRNPHGRGRKGHYYILTDEIRTLCDEVFR